MDLKDKIKLIKDKQRITQITISRVVKVPKNGGDVFLSLTSNYGTDEEGNEGLSMSEAKIASHLLCMEVNRLAYQQAAANNLISYDEMVNACNSTASNLKSLIVSEG